MSCEQYYRPNGASYGGKQHPNAMNVATTYSNTPTNEVNTNKVEVDEPVATTLK